LPDEELQSALGEMMVERRAGHREKEGVQLSV
jgi:hypothetical protein